MGIWRDQILPRMVTWGMAGEDFSAERKKALAPLSGRVLELGFGGGLNLPHYPTAGIDVLLALEPSAVAKRLAAERVAAAPFPVEFVGLEGASIPLEDDSVDAVASTWTLCTIADLEGALGEVRRVLRPGGGLHFLEHGLSRDAGIARWQERLNGLQSTLCGGCQLTRDFAVWMERAGFDVENYREFTMKGPRIHTAMYAGIARPD